MEFRTDEERDRWLNARLTAIHQRIQWIANEEVRSALVGGHAARGYFTKEKLDLLDQSEEVLDELNKSLGKD